MKNSLLRISLVMLLGLTVNTFTAYAQNGMGKEALAPDRVGHWDLGVGIAASMNDGADDSSFISAATSYGVTPYLAIGVEGGWQEADGDAADETIGYVPILADFIVRIPTVHEAIVPYGILGLGVAGVYVEDSDGSGRSNGYDSDDTGFAWKLGAGFDWFLNTNWIFNFEFAYWSADVDLPATSFGSDASFWTIGVGLKYMF
jgi:hypothetical protein